MGDHFMAADIKVMGRLVIPNKCRQWYKHTHTTMDNTTYRLNRPRGQFSKNVTNHCLGKCDRLMTVISEGDPFQEDRSVP